MRMREETLKEPHNEMTSRMAKQRDLGIDIMRFLGVLSIMIAHSDPPGWIFQLRNFGMPMLVVASGLAHAVIYQTKPMLVGAFYRHRLSRLVIPTWIFMVFFFPILYGVLLLIGKPYPFDLQDILGSFTFYSGTGFYWIFKIYIILALITPLALAIKKSTLPNTVYFWAIWLGYLAYEISIPMLTAALPASSHGFLNEFLFIVIPYTLIFLYGLRLAELSDKQILTVVVLSFGIFLIIALRKLMFFGEFIQTQEFKYPPKLYYLAYGFFGLNMVYLFGKKYAVKIPRPGVIIWLSSHSLWIYLWHIVAYYLWHYTLGSPAGSLMLSFASAVFQLGFGVGAVYLQERIVRKYLLTGRYRFTDWLGRMLS
jgi:peptidoglycan/LPS O-acetylase OafA/YrhL